MNWIYITAEVDKARAADDGGVDEIMVDLEWIGKVARQNMIDAHQARHHVDDIGPITSAVRRASVMVRINPLHEKSYEETEAVIARGAHRVMLPMFRDTADVTRLFELVGNLPVTLLVETRAALSNLPDYIGLLRSNDRIHFGLNDISLEYGLSFVFEPLAIGLLEQPAAVCRNADVPFGIGGLGRQGQGLLPPDYLIGEHVRLGSKWAILSRAFRDPELNQSSIRAELRKLGAIEEHFLAAGPEALNENRLRVKKLALEIAEANRSKSANYS